MLRGRPILHGAFLFRWRSFIPILMVPLALLAMTQSIDIEKRFGEGAEQIWQYGCLILAFLGLAVRVLTVGFVPGRTSGRNTTEQRADRLNTTGLYSIVRNPLYVGNFLMFMGYMLATKVWWLALLAAIVYWLYYRRIIATEEAFLRPRFGAEFETWAARTPAVVPNITGWRAPDLTFSWRTVLRREYVTTYSIVVIMTGIALADELIAERGSLSVWANEEPFWLWFFAIGTALFLALRVVKKRTDWLSVQGR
jgi:protein-S-isoprenylcysteine O-methyltransferase Ste14